MTDARAAEAGRRAGAVSRLVAFVVDALIVTAALRGTSWLLNAMANTLRRFAPPIDLAALLPAIVPLLVIAYNVGFWWLAGQTPGKWLLGIKIVPVEGGRLTLRRALLRCLAYILSALPFYLGFFWILGPTRRGWHDRIARTEVVYVPRRPTRDERDSQSLARTATA
jgi:uncharacterized RDD family membrane protein YckC